MPDLGQLQLSIAKILAEVSKSRTVITYSELCNRLHFPSPRIIGPELEKLDMFSYEKYNVFVSCLVVLKDCPIPSDGFFEVYLPLSGQNEKNPFVFAEEQKQLTYDLDWEKFLQEVEAVVNPKR